jgi:hypothetical protein
MRFRIGQLGLIFVSAALLCAAQQPSQNPLPSANSETTLDVKEIVRRGVEADQHNDEQARNYTYDQRSVQKELGKDGKIKKEEIRTYDITILYGQEYSRLIQKDDKPLSASDEKKEQEKLDKFIAKHKNESDEERRKRTEEEEKQRKKDRALFQDLTNAYDFKRLDDEKIDGHSVYVIEAIPHPGFHATQPHADIFSKLKGKLWIDKQTYEWVKAEAEAIDTISFGLFLARLHKGSHIVFEQTRINNEVWLPRHWFVDADARLLVFKNSDFQIDTTYSDYKQFKTAVKILPGVREAPANPCSNAQPSSTSASPASPLCQ